jgi:streptogramin lyase
MKTITGRLASVAIALTLFGCATPSNPAAVPAVTDGVSHRTSGPALRAFTAGSTPGLPITAVPRDIAVGPNGTVWFTDINTPAIGEISPGLKVTEFKTGLQIGAQPYAIVAGPDGNMWFSDETGAVGRITPSGAITEFGTKLLTVSNPVGLTVGADGALWTMTLGSASFLVRVSIDGKMSAHRVPKNLIPDGSLQADPHGNIWFFASLTNHNVVFVQRKSDGTLVAHRTDLMTRGEPCCPNLSANHITIGPNGNPWFTTPYFALKNSDGSHVGTFASGRATFFDVARGTVSYPVYPSGIVTTGNIMWYSGSDPIGFNGALWSMTAEGKQRVYPIEYDPAGLTAVDDKTLWFTSQAEGRAPQIVQAVF